MELIHKILKEKNVFFHQNEGITLVTVSSLHDGFALSQEILYTIVDPKTVFYLSGGSTPKILYERFAAEEQLLPGAVAMVDERYGPKFHEKSNEKMFQETGLLRYFQMRNIPFYPILQGKSREETAESYDKQLRTLNASYQKSVAILEVSADGSTVGIPVQNKGLKTESDIHDTYDFVTEYHDKTGLYGERVTMTFVGLSMLDVLLVLSFGKEKKEALEKVFTEGTEEEIPARFFKRPDIAKKTLFITDQRI